MAKPPNQSSTKEGQSSFKWPNGTTHTISWEQHKADMAAQAKANQGTAHWDPAWLAAVQAGQNPAQQPGGTFTPGSPGVPTPPVKPFLTGDQMGMNAQKQGAWRQSVIDIDKALSDLDAQTGLEQTNLEKSRIQSRENVQDSTAASGFTGSSVQDGDLFDIEATARLRREYMQTNLDNAKITAGNKKSAITDEQAAWDKALEQMKVENAAGVAASQGPWQTEPTAGSWQPAGPGNQAITGFAPPKGGTQAPVPGGPSTPGGAAQQDATNKFAQRQQRQGAVKTAQKKSGATPY